MARRINTIQELDNLQLESAILEITVDSEDFGVVECVLTAVSNNGDFDVITEADGLFTFNFSRCKVFID